MSAPIDKSSQLANTLAGLAGSTEIGNAVLQTVDPSSNLIAERMQTLGSIEIDKLGNIKTDGNAVFPVYDSLITTLTNTSRDQAVLAFIEENGIKAAMNPTVLFAANIAKGLLFGRVQTRTTRSRILTEANRTVRSSVLYTSADNPNGIEGSNIPAFVNDRSEFMAKVTSRSFVADRGMDQRNLKLTNHANFESVDVTPFAFFRASNEMDEKSVLHIACVLTLKNHPIVKKDKSVVRSSIDFMVVTPFGESPTHKSNMGVVNYPVNNKLIDKAVYIPLRSPEFLKENGSYTLDVETVKFLNTLMKKFFNEKSPLGIDTMAGGRRHFSKIVEPTPTIAPELSKEETAAKAKKSELAKAKRTAKKDATAKANADKLAAQEQTQRDAATADQNQ